MNTTSMPQCTVTVDDVYGAGWWENIKDGLREWRWAFRLAQPGETVIGTDGTKIKSCVNDFRLVILGPAMPSLRAVYNRTQARIREGYEWTGQFRNATAEEEYWVSETCVGIGPTPDPRLILRRTEPKVWFKAEEKMRRAKAGEWYTLGSVWMQALADHRDTDRIHLCATRHEEPTPAYTLTQEMVDAGRVR